ncbi:MULTISPECIES: YciI family protein [Sphingobium]|uniref:YciI family protein n=1 Tax=Sphingobium TaxID=165695 RepID=UPI0011A1040F|nr:MULTISPECIES: YciI family protein [Sphingobium]
MPSFIVTCVDGKDKAQHRAEARAQHLDYIEGKANKILLVGPLLDEENNVVGSLYMVEADDMAGAKAFVDADPFAKIGLFETVETRRFRTHLGTLLKR